MLKKYFWKIFFSNSIVSARLLLLKASKHYLLFILEVAEGSMPVCLAWAGDILEEKKGVNSSTGSGKIIVEFFSAEMLFNVCKYLSCNRKFNGYT